MKGFSDFGCQFGCQTGREVTRRGLFPARKGGGPWLCSIASHYTDSRPPVSVSSVFAPFNHAAPDLFVRPSPYLSGPLAVNLAVNFAARVAA